MQNNTLSRAELDATGDVLDIHYGDVLIKYGSILDATDNTIPHIISGHESTNYDYLQDGDIIVADTAEDETVGKTIELLNISGRKIEAGLHTVPCRPLFPFASMYLGYYMNTPHYHKQLVPLMQGIKVLSISKGNISKTEISSPQTIAEQEKISRFLYLLDQRAAAQSKIIDALKKYKRGLLNKLFSNINSNIYPTVYLSEVADFLQGLTYSPSDVSVSGYLVLRSSNIQNGMLSFDDCVYVDKKVDESLQVKCDDVIMCVRNGSKNLVGKTALIPPNMPMTTWGAFMMIIRSKLNDTYIFHYLNSQMFFSQVFKDAGTATINQITKGILNECKLPLPPETERKQISKMLSSFDAKIQNAEKCLATLVNLKKALLQQLFI